MTTGRINQVAAFRYFQPRRPPRSGHTQAGAGCLYREGFEERFLAKCGESNRLAALARVSQLFGTTPPRRRRGPQLLESECYWAPPIAGFAAPVLRSITSKPPSALDIQHITAGRPVPRVRICLVYNIHAEGWSATTEPYNPIYKQGQRDWRLPRMWVAARERSVGARQADRRPADQPHAQCLEPGLLRPPVCSSTML